MSLIDITGERYGRLVVIGYAGVKRSIKSGHTATMWNCKCDCGNNVVIPRYGLSSGNTKSCGCLKRETTANNNTTHGLSKSRLYRIWVSMKDRCFRSINPEYKNYGGRGITICEEWKNDFIVFHDWAMSRGYKDNITIDRIDVNGNYEPSNCQWISKSEQPKNRRNCHYITYRGVTKTLSEWSRELHIDRECVRNKESQLGDGELAIDAILNSTMHKRRNKTLSKN